MYTKQIPQWKRLSTKKEEKFVTGGFKRKDQEKESGTSWFSEKNMDLPITKNCLCWEHEIYLPEVLD